MHIKFNIFRGCKHQGRREEREAVSPISYTSFNLREEYANAFRTESYNDFWAHVLDLTLAHGAALKSRDCSAAARLPSYRLFAEQLLDPDQPTVTGILARARSARRHPAETHRLLSDYYSETADASLLCGLLLKDIEQVRLRRRPLKALLDSLLSDGLADRSLADLSETLSPFGSLASSRRQFQVVRAGAASLLKRLESGRSRARAKMRCIKRCKRALAVFLIALAVSSSVMGLCVAMHALVAAVALPTASSRWLAPTRWLDRVLAQLDAAVKGAYILNRDLDTISRLVVRLSDEVEGMAALLSLCCERRDDGLRLAQEVAREIWKNDARFNQQLDELEEQLYLCFMTINKARSLVMKEVLVTSRV